MSIDKIHNKKAGYQELAKVLECRVSHTGKQTDTLGVTELAYVQALTGGPVSCPLRTLRFLEVLMVGQVATDLDPST